LVILLATFILLAVLHRTVPRAIRARIPRPRETSQEQIELRTLTISQVVTRAISLVVWMVAFMMILGTVGINVTPLIASLGVAALALGFAAQNIIRDYLHGFFIVMEDWYRIGEVAEVAGIGGLVEDLNLRRTVLRDLNGTMHVIPNSNITVASNMTRDWSRVNLNVAVGYGEDLERVFGVINEVCQQLKEDSEMGGNLLTIPQAVRVDNLGDHGIEIKILADTRPAQQWALMGEIRRRLKDRFDLEGIEIPWPHTKVYFGNALVSDPASPDRRTLA
jgi:small conductance mechanosensitive channel